MRWRLIVSLLSLFAIVPLAGHAQLQPRPLSKVDALCRLTNCSQPTPLPAPQPKITSVVGSITPSAQALVAGTGFGSTPGALFLTTPYGYYHVKIESWGDTHVYGTIPQITGIPDAGGLLIVQVGQTESNHWPVAFKATREVAWVRSQPPISVISCTDADDRNQCLPQVVASHMVWILGARGTDVYSVGLRNGWVLSHTASRVDGLFASANLRGFASGVAVATLAVDWSYGFEGLVYYNFRIHTVGPKGVPSW